MNHVKEQPVVVSATERTNGATFDQDVEKELEDMGSVPEKYRGTAADYRDMDMLGKKQVLRVCFSPIQPRRRYHRSSDSWG